MLLLSKSSASRRNSDRAMLSGITMRTSSSFTWRCDSTSKLASLCLVSCASAARLRPSIRKVKVTCSSTLSWPEANAAYRDRSGFADAVQIAAASPQIAAASTVWLSKITFIRQPPPIYSQKMKTLYRPIGLQSAYIFPRQFFLSKRVHPERRYIGHIHRT